MICDLHERRNTLMAERIRKETGATVLAFHLDIADRVKVDAMIAETERELGRVDVLVCNAAENKLGKIVSYDMADWDRTIDVSLSANFYLARKVLPGMVARRRGSIVNISSVAGWIGNPNEKDGEPAYAADRKSVV